MLITGLRFILDKIAAAVDAELHDDTPLRERLLEAQMRLELGEIGEAEFRAIEGEVLARMRELKGPQNALTMSPGDRLAGVEVEVFDEGDRGELGGNGVAPGDGVTADHPPAGRSRGGGR
jgi:hypothetical protein